MTTFPTITAQIALTLAGAHVGDIFMSLIHTAELNHIAPFDYLVSCSATLPHSPQTR